MTGVRKIGIFLLTLKGPISGEVFKQLSEKEQEKCWLRLLVRILLRLRKDRR